MSDTDPQTVEWIWPSASAKIYHTQMNCPQRGETEATMPLETAEAWEYALCEYCDPDADPRGKAPTECDDCGHWRNRVVLDREGRSLCMGCREDRLTRGDEQ